jgi:glycosyltransferase involved in cell wall biosynthesis
MNKKILFDGLATQSTPNIRFHGGGEYAKFILRKAIEFGYRNFDIVFSTQRLIDIEIKELINEFEEIHVNYVRDKNELYSLIEQNKYDCFYSALPYRYTDYKLDTHFIMVIHGLRGIELPWDEYRHKYYKNRLKYLLTYIIAKSKFLRSYLKRKHISSFNKLIQLKNAKIITVSEHSKYSLLNFFPLLKASDITVSYSPLNYTREFSECQEYKRDYFLIISADRYEKNAYRAIIAFDELFSKGYLENKKVIVVGGKGLPFFKRVKNEDKFDLLPYVSTKELDDLFQNAFSFVYPSLNEGFGYPPLIAMMYHVPVLASSSTSIPEVCDNAALYFNPESIDDLSNRILQINYNDSLYTRLAKNGIKRISELKANQEVQLMNMLKLIFD